MNAGEISVGPNCKITFHFKVSEQQEIQRRPPNGDKGSLKAKLPAGNLLCAEHAEPRLYGGCRIEFTPRGEAGTWPQRLRALAFKIWGVMLGEGKVSIMGAKRGRSKGSESRIRGNLARK